LAWLLPGHFSGPVYCPSGRLKAGMSTEITTLRNGLRIVTDRMSSVETVAVGVWVAAGTRHETADINGISHLLEHMAFKGTKRRTAQTIAEEMDNVGGQLNAYTSRDHTAYFAKVLKEDMALAVDILADILLNPTMDEVELEREQHVVVQEINQADDTPDDIIFDHFQATAYPDQPMGWPVLGKEKIVRAITSERLKTYLTSNYAADTMVISAAGAVDHKAFVRLVEDAFGDLPERAKVSELPGRYDGGDFREVRKLEQVHLVLGFSGVPFEDKDFYNLSALSTLLGEGLSSRLFQEIREKRGLAYTVYSSAQSFSDTGLFSIYLGTGPSDVPKLIPVLCDEVKKMVDGVTADEVKRARAQIKAGLLMSLESPSSRCAQRARQIHIYGRPQTTQEIIEKVEQIDGNGITGCAQRIFSTPPTLAAMGELKKLETFEGIRSRLQ
jgi:predicted Zn-dependent peptidase